MSADGQGTLWTLQYTNQREQYIYELRSSIHCIQKQHGSNDATVLHPPGPLVSSCASGFESAWLLRFLVYVCWRRPRRQGLKWDRVIPGLLFTDSSRVNHVKYHEKRMHQNSSFFRSKIKKFLGSGHSPNREGKPLPTPFLGTYGTPSGCYKIIIIIIISGQFLFMVLTTWLRVIAWVRFTRWIQNSARRLPTFEPSRRTWAIGPPIGDYETTSIIAICY